MKTSAFLDLKRFAVSAVPVAMRFLRVSLLAGFLLLAGSLRAQDNWTAFPQKATYHNLWSIAYGNRTLVAVGEYGAIVSYSYIDEVWLPRYSATSAWLVGAGYGAGRFIVVGDKGTILTSDDAGETWTPRPSGTTTRLNAVAYGNGRWLIVGEQGSVLTSADGATWTARPALGTGFLRALAFGQGRFLIGGAGGALFSTVDAVTFVPVPINSTADIEGAAISTGHFWVVGSAGLRATATTLGNWSFAQLAPAPTLRGIAVRNDDEASAVGESYADTFLLSPSPGWRGYTAFPQFLATAVVQGEDEVVCVGFSGQVARSQMRSPFVLLSDTGQYAPYGSDVRLRIVSGQTVLASQWTRNGADLPGATKSELIIPQVRLADAATYAARVTLPTSPTPFVVDPYVLRPIPAGRPDIRDPTFTPALPFMPQLAVTQPDGKILVAGAFTVTTARGPLRGLARLNADGSLDDGFGPGEGIPSTQTIEAIHLLPDGRCYVRGNFTTIGGLPRAHLARLLADGTVDPAFQPGAALASITGSALAPDGRLYVHNGPSPNATGDILRVSADGARDPSFVIPAIDGIVDVDSQGRFLLIKTVPGPPPYQNDQRLVRYLADGSPDPSYTSSTIIQSPPGAGVAITPVRLTDAGLYYVGHSVGGRFGPITYFGRKAPNGGEDRSYSAPPESDYPQITLLEYRHRADGGFWQMRSQDSGKTYRARSYDPAGREETNRYATMPDCSFYWIGPTAPDGSFFAASYPALDSTRVNFFRARPFFGRIGRLANLSVRAFVASAAEPLIAGFVTLGTGGTTAIVRAVGPGLGGFGVADAMRDPSLKLVRDGLEQSANDDWNAALAPRFAAVGAFPLAAGSRDAALEAPIVAGNYSAVVVPPAGESGTALVELFEATDAATPTRRFVNVSARAQVTPERPLIVGFSVLGEVPVTILVRGVGPMLTRFGVAGALTDPKLTLYRNGTALWENAGISSPTENPLDPAPSAVAQRTGAFSISSDDAAMVVTLAPGSYSAVVTSAGRASGTALVEVYEVP